MRIQNFLLNIRAASYAARTCTSLKSHDFFMMRVPSDISNALGFGGERGIRTPGAMTLAGFQDQCIRPLCHFSFLLSRRDLNPRPQHYQCYALTRLSYETILIYDILIITLNTFYNLMDFCKI